MLKRRLEARNIEAVDDAVAAILRTMTTWERAQMIFDANKTMRLLIEGHLRTLHPDWTDDEIQSEIAHRMLHGAD